MSCVKKTFRWFLPVLVMAALGAFIASPALAGITITGTVVPGDSDDWNSSTDAKVGETGTGSVLVDAGSALYSKDTFLGGSNMNMMAGTGTVTVTGASSTWTTQSLKVGNALVGAGTGVLYVQNGGSVNVLESLHFSNGMMAAGHGEAIVDGANSLLDVGETINVGLGYSGSLTITNGGAVTSSTCLIKNNSVVTVDGNGSSMNVGKAGSTYYTNGDFTVGKQTGGTLNITNQGTVMADNFYVGLYNADGLVNFGSNGGTLTVKALWATPSQLAGTGTAVTHGLFTDANLTFDSSSSLIQTAPGFEASSVDVSLDVSDSSFRGDLGVGYAGDGTLSISNGVTVYSASGYLGNLADIDEYLWCSSGTATVDAAKWDLAGDLTVGYYQGHGLLNIQNGGLVEVAGRTVVNETYGTTEGAIYLNGGTLDTQSLSVEPSRLTGSGQINTRGLVSNVDLTFDATHDLNPTVTVGSFAVDLDMTDSDDVGDLGAGYSGSGSVRIADGLTLTSLNGSIGDDNINTHGTITVDGAAWNIKSRLSVGWRGYGKLHILNGGSVQCDEFSFATYGYGTVTVDGPGSSLSASSAAWIGGQGGVTRLDITNGAALTTPNNFFRIDDEHVITVDGSGSTWNLGSTEVDASSGTITVSNGGVINTRSTVTVGGAPNFYVNGGAVRATADSTWKTYSAVTTTLVNVYVGSQGATFDTNGNTFNLGYRLIDDGAATGSVTKVGAGNLIFRNESYVMEFPPESAPLYHPTPNTYTGLTTVEAGQLTLHGQDVADPGAWNPVLNLGGADIKGGKLVFDYTGFPSSPVGQGSPGTSPASTVQSLLATSYASGWTTGQFRSTTAGSDYSLGWMDDGVSQVTVMFTLEGDSNLDGSVNGTDLNAVLSNYNQSGQVWACGDFNYDGSVNGTDLNTVLSNYNQSLSSSTAAVPEPSTLLLVIVGLVGLLAVRRVRACTHQ